MSINEALCQILPPDRVKTRLIDRYAYASDASHFYLVPEAVVLPVSDEEVKALFRFSQQHRIPLTFRAGGTSLSGQSVTNGILVDVSRHWRRIVPEQNGQYLRVQPAVIGINANIVLKKYGRKIGPDPASINAAMMGGILSNNSSGMCCGVRHNAYHTLKYISFILPNGAAFSTENKNDYARFETEQAHIAEGIRQLRGSILASPELTERIRSKYRQKNTTGYGLNAFLDYKHPLDVLAHLLIGAEGTLGFISEAVLETVPDLPYKLTAMLYFETPEAACQSIFELKESGAEALEFMDRAALRSVEHQKGVPDFVKNLPPRAAALLCEYQSDTEEGLQNKFQTAQNILQKLNLRHEARFSSDADEQALMWKIRKGMYPSAASVRAKGTATMLEDVVFPVERLAEAIVDVQGLFDKHGYEGIIFGHAKDGNLHFCIAQSFADAAEVQRFKRFNDDLFEMVIHKYNGALKAEHGTGRAVAPFVEAEWGSDAFKIMQALKKLIDPDNLLNPGVILPQSKNSDVENLKTMPVVEAEVDKCVECGFCERRCPSRDYTLTPRQRIGIRRALKRLATEGDTATYNKILQDYQHDGMDTCAVDGMCATDCPVDINTGELIKRLRRENHSPRANRWAVRVARHFATVTALARLGIRVGRGFNTVFGKNALFNLTSFFRKISHHIPLWSNEIGQPLSYSAFLQKVQSTKSPSDTTIVYYPTCISRMMNGSVADAFLSVCQKAKITVKPPAQLRGGCCGQLFSSKGFSDAFTLKVNETIAGLWADTAHGQYPVVLDVTSCTYTLQHCRSYLTPENQSRFDALRFYDSIDFAADIIVPRLTIRQPKERIVFHPVCSAHKMGLLPKLQVIGKACAQAADVPALAGCCGTAGDRGFYYPALPQAATAAEAAEVRERQYDGYYSSAKTCEMALSEAVGQPYQSVFNLLDEVAV